EYVVECAIVALCPHGEARLRVDQLDRNAEAVAGLAYAAVEERPDAELLSHCAAIDPWPAETKRRGARRGPQSFDTAQRVNNLFGNAIAEVGLVRLGAQIGERQYRHGRHLAGLVRGIVVGENAAAAGKPSVQLRGVGVDGP